MGLVDKIPLYQVTKKKSAQLAMIVTVSGLIYLFLFSLPFPLVRFYNTVPPVDYTKLTNYSQLGLMVYVLGLGALFWLYIWAIRLASSYAASQNLVDARPGDDAPDARLVFGGTGLLVAVSLIAYPLTAIDLFIYAIRTRGWALYGLNPLATAPELLPAGDPWLGLAAEWVDAPSPYGPLWEWSSLGTFLLSGGDFLTQLFALKILMALAYLGCVWLVYHILRLLQPAWAVAGTIAFAWNPLVILESVQNAHNDILMTFFFLAAVAAYVWWIVAMPTNWPMDIAGAARQGYRPSLPNSRALLWPGLTCLCLALSILVKFVTIITVPFFLIGMAATQRTWPRRVATAGWAGLAIALLVVLPMLPLWPGWENWAVLQAGSQAGRSLLALMVLGLRDRLSTNTAFNISRNLILFIFLAIYLFYLWRSLGSVIREQLSGIRQHLDHIISPMFFTLFWYVLLAAPVFHAWYLLWFFPLAALRLPDREALIPAIVFSLTALLVIPYFETIRVWYPFLLQNHFLGHVIGVPLLILPPAVAALWLISRSRHSGVR